MPQIPWLAFSFCRLARFGPCVGVVDFLIPAPVLAVFHRLPKASPPPTEGLAAGFEKLVADEGVGRLPPRAAGFEPVVGVG